MNFSDLFNWPEYAKLLVGLLALANPFGVLPVLMGATKDLSGKERLEIVRTSVIVFVVTMLIFVFIGYFVLGLFGITIAAFRIAGGILFLFFSLSMLGVIDLPQLYTSGKGSRKSLGIVPLGIPLLAGPGTISNIIIYSSLHEGLDHKIVVSIVAILTGVAVYAFVWLGMRFGLKLSDSTTIIINRVMGLLLAAIAVEFILDGIAAHYPDIRTID